MKEELLFSFSREAMLKRCSREFYLHAFYAYGEYEVGAADSERNHVHLLKQLKTAAAFKEFLLQQSLRKVFVDGKNVDDLLMSLRFDFFRAKDDMWLGEYENDHLAHPVLYDFYYDETSFDEMFTALHDELSAWASKLLDNDLFLKLFRSERQNFYIEPDVAHVLIGNIKIHFPLVGVIQHGGIFYCINFVRRSESFDTAAVFDLFYCQQKLHLPLQNVAHVFLNEKDTLFLYNDNSALNISAVLDEVVNRAEAHFYWAEQLKNYFSPFAVPEADNKETCRHCRFREFCRG